MLMSPLSCLFRGGRRCGATTGRGAAVLCAAAAVAALLPGCAENKDVLGQVNRGEYGRARADLAKNLEKNKSSREYMYDRMVLTMVDLADGLPQLAEPTANEVFKVLHTRGINDDKTIAAVVLWEGIKFWKGEPFEQAMMLCYIAQQKAMSGRWDDARAAAVNSLFWLKDFGKDAANQRKSGEDIAREAAQRDQQSQNGDYFETGYAAAESNFALGYLLAGAINGVLGKADPDREAEALEQLAKAVSLDQSLRPVAERLRSGAYNTILVVDYGLGPTKVACGMDGVFTRFEPKAQWPSGSQPLLVTGAGPAAESFPVACDLNVMAADHMWNNTEDVRAAKSVLGTALLAGGAAAAAFGHDEAQIVGVAMMALGASMKATAGADTTHCRIMPQRVYLAPVMVAQPDTRLELQVAGRAEMVLVSMDPPEAPDRVQLRYVRIPPGPQILPWATAGELHYANDHHPTGVQGDELPWILGGRCVRRPSVDALLKYQLAGHLRGLTVSDLESLYREEGIVLQRAEVDGERAGRHILEGGDALDCPLPGTAGYARLFCQDHGSYQPRSQRVRELAEEARSSGRGVASAR
jgi:hypothetical protein